jgi:hypothetical protein
MELVKDNKPRTKEEIEADLKKFLQIISPIVELTKSSSNTMLIVTKLMRKLQDPNFVNFKELGPLLDKYQYLIKQ